MLQIVQGKYFRDVPLTDTIQRGILYTNLRAVGDREAHSLLFGRLLPSTITQGVGSLTIEAREQLEALTEQGHMEVLVATSGEQLIDEIAAVISFCLNAVCVRDQDLARRLISPRTGNPLHRQGPGGILRQTFDADVILTEDGLADLDHFLGLLVALERKSYEAAIRAIRQIVDATLMVGEDATLSYTLMVAALESLGRAQDPGVGQWADYEDKKRARIDDATKGLGEARKERIRSAILANEHHALSRRFCAFVLDHVKPSFYREEAVGALAPISADELPAALRNAYDIRSRNVHALQILAPEVSKMPGQADTSHVEARAQLALEGLARLSRHVVRRFVERAPKGVDKTFRYRSALPDIMRGRWAPQYWIHQADGFTAKSAPVFLDGMVSFLIEGLSGRSEAGLTPMTAVLDKIEKIAPGISKAADRIPMAGIMALWNNFAPDDQRRKLKPKLGAQLEADLGQPSVVGFMVITLLGGTPGWTAEEFRTLATERRAELRSKLRQPLPKRIDASLFIVSADRLLAEGDRAGGLAELSHAVETVPGLPDLIKYEAAIRQGENPRLDLRRFLLGEAEFVTRDSFTDPAHI